MSAPVLTTLAANMFQKGQPVSGMFLVSTFAAMFVVGSIIGALKAKKKGRSSPLGFGVLIGIVYGVAAVAVVLLFISYVRTVPPR